MKKSDLELEADRLLESVLKDHRRNKSKADEYPILSDSQLARRRSKEIPSSSLSLRQRLESETDKDTDDF